MIVLEAEPLKKAALQRAQERLAALEEAAPGIYAEPRQYSGISPSAARVLFFCPRLAWLERRHQKSFATEYGVYKMELGHVIHQALQERLGGTAELRIERRLKDVTIVGVADLVFDEDCRDRRLCGSVVEIKTGRPSPADVLQLSLYAAMLSRRKAYLLRVREEDGVFVGTLERVQPQPREAARWLKRYVRVVASQTPPPPGRPCSSCVFKKLCARLLSASLV